MAGLLALAPSLALAQTVGAIVYDGTSGQVRMVVVPDTDKELDDPAFSPVGAVQQRVPIVDLKTLQPRDLYLKYLPKEVWPANMKPLYTPEEAAKFGVDPYSGKPTGEP